MSITIEVSVGGRNYPIVCDESDAPRIRELSTQLAARASTLQTQMGGLVPDAHLLVLTNLMALDELSETPAKTSMSTPTSNTDDEEILIQAVSHLTSRVNNIARQLRAA